MEHEDEGDTDCVWCALNDSQSLNKGLEELERGEADTHLITM